MNCKKCGAPLAIGDKFCKNCGNPVESVQTQGVVQPQVSAQPELGVQPQVNNMSTIQESTNLAGAPTVTPMNMTQPTGVINNTSKKNNNNAIIMPLILVAVIGVIIIVLLLNNNTNRDIDRGVNTPNVNNPTDKTPEVSPNKVSSTYKVSYGNFIFNIPDNLIYSIEDGSLMIGDTESTWQALLQVGTSSYDILKSNMGSLQSGMIQQGYNSTAAVVKTLGGIEYITLELNAQGENYVGAYSKLNSMNTIIVIAYNLDNTFDYSILEKVAPIISSSIYQGLTTNIENHINIDLTPGLELGR